MFYPLRHKYDELGTAGKRLSRIPRYARLIAMLPPGRFERLTSEPATFWEVYTYAADRRDETGLLDDGLKTSEGKKLGYHDATPPDHPSLFVRHWQIRLAFDLLSAVAFQMFCGEDGTGTKPPLTEVTRFDKFLKWALGRFKRSGAYRDSLDEPIADPGNTRILDDWDRLKAMDAHGLNYFVFSETNEVLRFNDRTTQAFFAACWACRWSDDGKDLAMMHRWLPDPLAGTNEDYLEFWQMVTEMPDEAIDDDFTRWRRLLAPVYDGSLRNGAGEVIRSTELIYRSFRRMKDTEDGRQFRNEFARLRQTNVVAKRLLTDAAGESHFLSLGSGTHGDEDDGTFQMGEPGGQDNPRHPVALSPYRLHRFCVTNEEYELFDPRHQSQREFQDEVENTDRHPVVNVSWYDGWCFAAWLGEIDIGDVRYRVELPTEAQWEYACRCKQQTRFTWGEGRDGDKIAAAYCNFGGIYNRGLGIDAPADEEGPFRNHTIAVDGTDGELALPPNRWGFHQMHGNVWEWCRDWYDPTYYRDSPKDDPVGPVNAIHRVLRGGSWIVNGWLCRSAYRDWSSPGNRVRSDGFRLAAVPVVSSKQERASGASAQRS